MQKLAWMRVAAFLGAVLVAPTLGGAATPHRDSRNLTAAENATFMRLACDRPHKTADGTGCAQLLGYGDGRPATFSLDAILYGSFSRRGVDEAYVSYSSSNEPHANNFGGGVLFARSAGTWRLTRWFPGWVLDRCAEIPNTAPQRLLCVFGSTGQGETTTSVTTVALPPRGRALVAGDALLHADDAREMSVEAENGCYGNVPPGRARLLSIDAIASTGDPLTFATARVSYETAADIARACRGAHRRKVHVTTGTVRFRILAGTIVPITPARFVETL